MISPNDAPFTPIEVWPLEFQPLKDLSIHYARYDTNRQDPRGLIDSLKRSVEYSEGGVALAVLKGERPQEYSDSEAMVVFNPFANAATPNMLVRAEFVRAVAKEADVRADDGKLKPVVMLGSPGLGGSKVRLSRDEKQAIAEGDLGPVSREMLRAVSEKGMGRVALCGFSMGADMALAGAVEGSSANVDVHAVSVGDPAGTEKRSMTQLAGDFFKAGAKDLKAAVAEGHLEAQKVALGSGVVDFARFGLSAVRPLNAALYRGLGKDSFERRMETIIEQGIASTLIVGYGETSAIAKPENVEPAMNRLYQRYGRESFASVRVQDAKHTWGDRLDLLAKLYMRAA